MLKERIEIRAFSKASGNSLPRRTGGFPNCVQLVQISVIQRNMGYRYKILPLNQTIDWIQCMKLLGKQGWKNEANSP